MRKRGAAKFRKTVLDHFKQHRRSFPWRETSNPYHIMVSEVMLQQTQAARVAQFYLRFLKKFPTPRALATAPLREVYGVWAGLGYNRRAKYLRDAATQIVKHHGGDVPHGLEELEKLPGIGPYTAAAVRAFAFNLPGSFLETNIRTAFIHHFFQDKKKVSDQELLPLVEAALAGVNPREWYSALMDYGAYLKGQGVRAHRKSRGYIRQKKFKGSVREARGKILRVLDKPKTEQELSRFAGKQTGKALAGLLKDGVIRRKKNRYRLAK